MPSLITPILNAQNLIESLSNRDWEITQNLFFQEPVKVHQNTISEITIVSPDITVVMSVRINMHQNSELIKSISCSIAKFEDSRVHCSCEYICMFLDNEPSSAVLLLSVGNISAQRCQKIFDFKTFLKYCPLNDPSIFLSATAVHGNSFLDVFSNTNMIFVRDLMFPDVTDIKARKYFSIFDSEEEFNLQYN